MGRSQRGSPPIDRSVPYGHGPKRGLRKATVEAVPVSGVIHERTAPAPGMIRIAVVIVCAVAIDNAEKSGRPNQYRRDSDGRVGGVRFTDDCRAGGAAHRQRARPDISAASPPWRLKVVTQNTQGVRVSFQLPVCFVSQPVSLVPYVPTPGVALDRVKRRRAWRQRAFVEIV